MTMKSFIRPSSSTWLKNAQSLRVFDGMRHIFGVVFLALVIMGETAVAQSTATFYKDVLPILQKNCQGCHRPGEVAPMSLLTYSEARPWAKAISSQARRRGPTNPVLAHQNVFSTPRRVRDIGMQKWSRLEPHLQF